MLTSADVKFIRELASWYSDACSDMAYTADEGDWGFEDEIARLRKSGCQDVSGALADNLYNDVDTARDLLGDRLCERFNEQKNPELWKAACIELEENLSHLKGLAKALYE